MFTFKHLATAISLLTVANFSAAATVGLEYKTLKTDYELNGSKQNLSGAALVFATNDDSKTKGWVSLESLNGDTEDVQLLEVTAGFQNVTQLPNNFVLLTGIGVGVGSVKVEDFANTNNILTVPIGIELAYNLKKVALYTGISYKFIYEIDPSSGAPTVCNDGTTSNSTGSGTCSSHGGIAYYTDEEPRDEIGNGTGVDFKVGLRYKF